MEVPRKSHGNHDRPTEAPWEQRNVISNVPIFVTWRNGLFINGNCSPRPYHPEKLLVAYTQHHPEPATKAVCDHPSPKV